MYLSHLLPVVTLWASWAQGAPLPSDHREPGGTGEGNHPNDNSHHVDGASSLVHDGVLVGASGLLGLGAGRYLHHRDQQQQQPQQQLQQASENRLTQHQTGHQDLSHTVEAQLLPQRAATRRMEMEILPAGVVKIHLWKALLDLGDGHSHSKMALCIGRDLADRKQIDAEDQVTWEEWNKAVDACAHLGPTHALKIYPVVHANEATAADATASPETRAQTQARTQGSNASEDPGAGTTPQARAFSLHPLHALRVPQSLMHSLSRGARAMLHAPSRLATSSSSSSSWKNFAQQESRMILKAE
ncbi:MAG: hypothetical protein M1826_000067 [Phylliscum demangeonii]|nr:MAG: hypothetical protein M1826_000067 [Phylliscum demangeonii]